MGEQDPYIVLYTWIIFLGILAISWDSTMAGIISRLHDDLMQLTLKSDVVLRVPGLSDDTNDGVLKTYCSGYGTFTPWRDDQNPQGGNGSDQRDFAEQETGGDAQECVRRTYLMTLVGYAFVMLWIKVMAWAVLAYVAVFMSAMMSYYAVFDWTQRLLLWFGDPNHAFQFLHNEHMPFHALVVVVTVLAMSAPILFFIKNEELDDRDAVRVKMYRILFVAASVAIFMYAVYALACLVGSF